LRVDLTGGLTARSGGDLYVGNVSGTLNVVTIFADGTANLYGDVVADDNDTAGVSETNISASALNLYVNSFGTSSNPIEIELDSDGALAGTVKNSVYASSAVDLLVDGLSSRSGSLSVTSSSDLSVGYVAAFNGTVTLKSTAGDILDANGVAMNVP